MQFKNTIEKSKAIHRFMQVERLSTDQVYELYFECFCSYRDMFLERIRHGYELRKVIKTYREIPGFMKLSPSDLEKAVFNSPVMHSWFAFRFWQAIDMQVLTGKTDQGELVISLTYLNQIPAAYTMEEILHEWTVCNQYVPERSVGRVVQPAY